MTLAKLPDTRVPLVISQLRSLVSCPRASFSPIFDIAKAGLITKRRKGSRTAGTLTPTIMESSASWMDLSNFLMAARRPVHSSLIFERTSSCVSCLLSFSFILFCLWNRCRSSIEVSSVRFAYSIFTSSAGSMSSSFSSGFSSSSSATCPKIFFQLPSRISRMSAARSSLALILDSASCSANTRSTSSS